MISAFGIDHGEISKGVPVSRLKNDMPFAFRADKLASGWVDRAKTSQAGATRFATRQGEAKLSAEHTRALHAAGKLKNPTGATQDVVNQVRRGQMHPNFGRYLEGKVAQQSRPESPVARAQRKRAINAKRTEAPPRPNF